jgi:hypothetical protein
MGTADIGADRPSGPTREISAGMAARVPSLMFRPRAAPVSTGAAASGRTADPLSAPALRLQSHFCPQRRSRWVADHRPFRDSNSLRILASKDRTSTTRYSVRANSARSTRGSILDLTISASGPNRIILLTQGLSRIGEGARRSKGHPNGLGKKSPETIAPLLFLPKPSGNRNATKILHPIPVYSGTLL